MVADKMVWTKWYTDKMVLDKMVRTKWYGPTQNGIRTKWYWTKWYGQNGIGQNGTILYFAYIVIQLNSIVIVIVNSKLLKRHSKAKRRAPAYSRALRQNRGVFQ